MKKILINRRPLRNQAWGGGNHFVIAAYDILPLFGYEPILRLEDNPDIVLMVDPRVDEMGIGVNEIASSRAMLQKGKHPIIVHRVNECDARKGTTDIDEMLLACHGLVDEQVFVSKWLRQHLHEKWALHNGIKHGKSLCPVIYNGVDRNIFHPNNKNSELNHKTNIVMAHWSDNAMKGQDYAEFIDDFVGRNSDFTFTFIGRTKAIFKNSRHLGPLHGKELGDELGRYDVCINGSRFDPGPNSVIEPIACGLPTYVHADGGGGVEFAGADHTFSSTCELESLLSHDYVINNAVTFKSWMEVIREYASLFDELIANSS